MVVDEGGTFMKSSPRAGGAGDADHAASEAMERYAAGDDAAFAELYDLVAPRLFAYLLRRTRDADAAQDLAQQTLLLVHRARASYLRGAQVMPWLLAIARRLVIDWARKANRDPLSDAAGDLFELPSRAAGAEELVSTQQLASSLESALAALPEPQRRAFELVKQRGLSLSETAAALKITVGAVKLRIHRAHQALRARITGREST